MIISNKIPNSANAHNTDENIVVPMAIETRKIYFKPCLTPLGDLRTVTLGTSQVGGNESGPMGTVYIRP